MATFIGIDQSLTGTGTCILDCEGRVVDTLLVKPKKLKGVERLDFIVRRIVRFTEQVSGDVFSCREEYSFSSKGRSVFNLGELGGCIDLALYNLDRPQWTSHAHYRIPPSTHKKFCVLDGAATKGSVKKDKLAYLAKIAEHTGEEFDDDNVADSFMLAKTLWGFRQCLESEAYFDALLRERRESLVPPKMRKKMKITPSKVQRMGHEAFSELIRKGFAQTYLVFERASAGEINES